VAHVEAAHREEGSGRAAGWDVAAWAGALGSGLVPCLLALALGALVLALTGKSPWDFYSLLWQQAFGSRVAIASTLADTTPLIFTGLGIVVAFRAGVFNVGVEGSLYVGAFAAAWAGFTWLHLPALLLVPLCFALASVAGVLWALPAAALKAYLAVDEVVTTFMLNYIAILVCSYLVNYAFLARGTANSSSPLIAAQAQLPALVAGSQLTSAFVLALVCVVAFEIVLRRTTLGLRIRLTGANPRFAAVAGLDVRRVIVASMVLSGLMGGLAGAGQILGALDRFVDNFSPGYGYTGIAVALLARNQPWAVPLAALFFGALANGGTTVQLFTNVPLDLVNVLQGAVMLVAVTRLGVGIRRARAAAPVAPEIAPEIKEGPHVQRVG
jgi:simple sugar transport system permease protein